MIFNLIRKAKEVIYKNGQNVEDALDELNSNLIKTGVTTGTYLVVDEVFTVPADGYIKLAVSYHQDQWGQLAIQEGDDPSSIKTPLTTLASPKTVYSTTNLTQSIYVKKGMKFLFTKQVATNGSVVATYYQFV